MAASAAARELRYDRREATFGNLAYDLDRELRERELSHAGELPRRREQAAAAPQVRAVAQVQVRQRQKLSFAGCLGFAAVAALAALTLFCYVQLTILSGDVVSMKSELATLETENVTLTAQYEQMFDLKTVKEAAQAAGMSKPSSGQIYYIDLSGGDSAVVYQKEDPGLLTKLLASLNHGLYTVMEYFD